MKHPPAARCSGLYIGLLSGTSIDGVDTALVHIDETSVRTVCSRTHELEQSLRSRLLTITEATSATLEEIGTLDREFAIVCARAVQALLLSAGVPDHDIVAVGSHGQTIRHRPDPVGQRPGFTWQIGDPSTIAELTGICTVADFRRRDIAAGGQGAPLVPAFHNALFRKSGVNRIVANIGGISNITLLPGELGAMVGGFDTGPGNTLMDGWIRRHRHQDFDTDGAWAASGCISRQLLEKMLEHPFLRRPTPKSTGREDFNLGWLDGLLADMPRLDESDIQATLLELTAQTLCSGAVSAMPDCREVYLCGGGAKNGALRRRIETLMGSNVGVRDTGVLGIDPDWVEACAFAWMAWRTLRGESCNLPEVTGATREACLGGIYPGRIRPVGLEGE